MPTKFVPARPDPWGFLTRFTTARIALGRAGSSLPTAALLEFQLAHARASDAVHRELDDAALCAQLSEQGREVIRLCSAVRDRREFIARPDLGRILSPESIAVLETRARLPMPVDALFVIADGLSAMAVQRHAAPLLALIMPMLAQAGWSVAPLCVVRQGRVAIADEIGALLYAKLSVLLIGERPGLSSPDSLGIYLTYEPRTGRGNAERNCISNVRAEGLSYERAARTLFHLMKESRRLRLSGVALKEDAPEALPQARARAALS